MLHTNDTHSYIQIAQVLLLATFGVLIGDALTIGMASLLPAAMPFHLDMKDMLLISVAFIVITVLASLLSIRRFAKIDPIEIINGGEA
ncbi:MULTISPECIES: FtsX-like permease family protein [unclassified Streptococcus]|uniref:FtsX-like permease family protein n=1 Tax=unclassified Streptococcus TaxID=2608887 RepID=UPI00066FE42B|nr:MULTISPECIES: FtsX-like permease family protein [unclassified Streptococcus]